MNAWTTGIFAALLLVSGAPALADGATVLLAESEVGEEGRESGDMDRDRLREQERTAERISKDLAKQAGMTERQEYRLQNRVQQHLALGGDENNVKEMTRTALNEGCQGDCLNEAVRYMNQAMHQQGHSAVAAREMVSEELRQAAREGDPAGLTARFERRMEERVGPAPRQRRDERGPIWDDGTGRGMGGPGGRR